MRERKPLEAVLLDAGGTLVRLDFERMVEELGELGTPTTVEALRRAEIGGRRRYDASGSQGIPVDEREGPLGGAGDIRAYFDGMFEAAGVPPDVRERMAQIVREREARPIGNWGRPVEGAERATITLRDMGLRVAVVSNSDGRAEEHLVHGGVRDSLEFVVDSQIVGVEKPDPEIYRIALRRLGVEASRSLYVGDLLSVDARGAAAAGMDFVLLDPYGDYATDGVASIRSIADLPEWIASAYELTQPRTQVED